MNKQIKGEKYIYLTMAFQLAKEAKARGENFIKIGNDNGFKGEQHFERTFSILDDRDNPTGHHFILRERKMSVHQADFCRYFQVIENTSRPSIWDMGTESLWSH